MSGLHAKAQNQIMLVCSAMGVVLVCPEMTGVVFSVSRKDRKRKNIFSRIKL